MSAAQSYQYDALGRRITETAGDATSPTPVTSLGGSSPAPSNLINDNGLLFFTANDGTHGTELWVSDGSSSGTHMVADIDSGSNGSNPSNFCVVDGILYFQANNGTSYDLWRSDGTSAGTYEVKAVTAQDLIDLNGELYFQGNDGTNAGLWKSDGTSAGTVFVYDVTVGYNSMGDDIVVGNTLFFWGDDGTHGYELWKSDGTSAGTEMVKDIDPGSTGSWPWITSWADVNGTLFFGANDGTDGEELWKSDGTSAGTVMVKDIEPGSGGSIPFSLTDLNGVLVFSADTTADGWQLWRSDGTSDGTYMIPSNSIYAENFCVVNGILYFAAWGNDTSHYELFRSDGTADGTYMVADPGGITPYQLADVDGTLYFQSGDSTTGVELWTSDGTAAGTHMVADINSGSGSSNPSYLTAVGGTLYFTATDGVHGTQVWKYNVVTDLYYSSSDQVVEEQTSTYQTIDQYVWSPMYVNAMVERDVDTNGDGTLDQRIYVQQDANWNVTSIADSSGTILERYLYTPYGMVTVLNGDFSTVTGNVSSYNWEYFFQGGKYDLATGLYNFQHRDLDPTTGDWIEQDPTGYVDSMNLYEFAQDNPLTRLDPSGLNSASLPGLGGGLGGIGIGIGGGGGVGACPLAPIGIEPCQHECDQVAKAAKGKVPPGVITIYLNNCYKCCGMSRDNSQCPFKIPIFPKGPIGPKPKPTPPE